MKPLLFLPLLFCVVLVQNCQAQDLTGTWQGVNNSFKIVLVHVNDSCMGYTYDSGLGYCKANFIGTYTGSTKKLRGTNTNFIEKTFAHGLSSYKLTYSKQPGGEYLTGHASPKSTVGKVFSIGMGISLLYKKTSEQFDTTEMMAKHLLVDRNKKSISIPGPDVEKKLLPDSEDKIKMTTEKEKRATRVFDTIYTNSDSVRLLIYDNGEIDNDTVTVFQNGQIIINKLNLTAQPFQMMIALPSDREQSIELMANNLGSIPPNTAYLVIMDGQKKYELRLSANFSQNAGINITRKK